MTTHPAAQKQRIKIHSSRNGSDDALKSCRPFPFWSLLKVALPTGIELKGHIIWRVFFFSLTIQKTSSILCTIHSLWLQDQSYAIILP